MAEMEPRQVFGRGVALVGCDPVASDRTLGGGERHLMAADQAPQDEFERIFVGGVVLARPWLQPEVVRIGWCATDGERDQVIELVEAETFAASSAASRVR